MVQRLDLRHVEVNIFRSTYQDGLMELYLGLVLLSLGSGRVLDALNLSENATLLVGVISGMALVIGLVVLREYVVIPRRGRVRFSSQRRRRQQRVALGWIVGTYTAFGILYAVGTAHLALGRGVVLAIFGTIIVLPFWLCAHFLQIPRLYSYGALIVAALLVGHQVRNTLAGLIAAGGVMIVIGIVLLIRFVREHPIPSAAEAMNGNIG
jgi:hypothetical protein